MYIPSLLFGAGKSDCVAVRGTSDSGSFQSGSEIWDYYKFANVGSASFQVLAGSTVNARIFMVAGGGGGGYSLDNTIGGLSAGGGGAGGVVYTQATLGIGTYPLYVGDGADVTGSGEESWIDIDSALIPASYLSYFTSGSRLTAEGGGSGAWFTSLSNGFGSAAAKVDAANGGSGGGGIQALRWADPPNGPNGYVTGTQGGGRNPQGNNGGTPDGLNCTATVETTATGGGGVKTQSANTDCTAAVGYQTPGGEGDFYNVDGTPKQYAYGGASMRTGVWEAAPYDSASASSRAIGAGGWGTSDLYPVALNKDKGVKGEIVILVPVCRTEKTECTTYSIGGGVSGGNITYIPCGESFLTSSAVIAGDTLSICSFPITDGTPYPSGSGTVTVTAGADCSEYIPPTPIPTPDVPCDCRTITFTAGSGGGVASWYECGVSQSSYDTDQFVSSGSIAANQTLVVCSVSGSYKSMTGSGAGISIGGACTSSLPLCNP